MKNCIYSIQLPQNGLCCAAYSCSKRPDGKFWAHFPKCLTENCPFDHPELLDGATFDKKEFDNTLKIAKQKEMVGRR